MHKTQGCIAGAFTKARGPGGALPVAVDRFSRANLRNFP